MTVFHLSTATNNILTKHFFNINAKLNNIISIKYFYNIKAMPNDNTSINHFFTISAKPNYNISTYHFYNINIKQTITPHLLYQPVAKARLLRIYYTAKS